jgi:hypothetical protein
MSRWSKKDYVKAKVSFLIYFVIIFLNAVASPSVPQARALSGY